ncbi:MAG: hypothetical protein LBR23_00705 [Spirochaetaceae bacterium]|nr:hypothetical protein [Spirochaetaceae bacterium]
MNRKLVFFPLVAALSFSLSAAPGIATGEQASWRILERAMVAFDSGKYGAALALAEQAREQKRINYEGYAQTLTRAMIPQEVQRAGDDIPAVIAVLESRQDREALRIITFYAEAKGVGFFDRRVTGMIDFLRQSSVFPEADLLIGRVYRHEGELDLAKQYCLRAWEQSFALDVPDQKYDILYQLADLAEITGDEELLEQSLLLVLAEDPYFNDAAGAVEGAEGGASFYDSLRNALGRNYSVDRIFEMYRVDSYRSLEAYAGLSRLYRDRGDNGRFLKTAILGSLSAFTRMYEVLTARNVDYSYRGVGDFFTRALRYRDVTDWSLEHPVWGCFNYLSEAAERNSLGGFAGEIDALLEAFSPDRAVGDTARVRAESRGGVM